MASGTDASHARDTGRSVVRKKATSVDMTLVVQQPWHMLQRASSKVYGHKGGSIGFSADKSYATDEDIEKSVADDEAETDDEDVYHRSSLLCYSYLPDEPNTPDDPWGLDQYHVVDNIVPRHSPLYTRNVQPCSPAQLMDRVAERPARFVDDSRRLEECRQEPMPSLARGAVASNASVLSGIRPSDWFTQCQVCSRWSIAASYRGCVKLPVFYSVLAKLLSGCATHQSSCRGTPAALFLTVRCGSSTSGTSKRWSQHAQTVKRLGPIDLQIEINAQECGSEQSFLVDAEGLELNVSVRGTEPPELQALRIDDMFKLMFGSARMAQWNFVFGPLHAVIPIHRHG